MKTLIVILISLLFSMVTAMAGTNLFLFGGGSRPRAAIQKFSQAAGGPEARILIIGWASAIPADYAQSLSKEFSEFGAKDFLLSLNSPKTDIEKKDFLKKLADASGVFFTGGDQNHAMATVETLDLRAAFKTKFEAGTPFAGTSAGTALMAETMMTGDETPIGRGLGLYSKAIIDMHFLKRNREDRLVKAMTQSQIPFGIGVDEDGALLVENTERATVLGERHVVFYAKPNRLATVTREELTSNQTFNLIDWK